jgi:hypothetical protein
MTTIRNSVKNFMLVCLIFSTTIFGTLYFLKSYGVL